MAKYKIAFITHEYPPIGGGAASALLQLTRNLAASHEILVLTIGQKNQTVEYPKIPNLNIVEVANIRKALICPSKVELIKSYFALRFNTAKYLDNFKPNYIIAFFGFPAANAIVPYAKSRSIPLITSIRGSDAPGFNGKRLGIGRYVLKRLLKPVVKASSLVYANGQRLQNLMQAAFPNIKVHSIPNGIFIPDTTNLKTRHNEIRILTVGQLIERKQVTLALKSVIEFARTNLKRITYTVVGDGYLLEELKALARSAPCNLTVRFTGHIPREDIQKLYLAHDICLHLSKDEGVSNTILEALVFNLIIIASTDTIADFSNLTSANILQVDKFKIEDIANTLKVAEDSVSTNKESVNNEVLHKFSWSIYSDNLIKLIEDSTRSKHAEGQVNI